jgi:hypothetical protein
VDKHNYLKLFVEFSENTIIGRGQKDSLLFLVASLCIEAINYEEHLEEYFKPSKFCIILTNPNKFIKLGEDIMRKTCACE